MKHCQMVTFMNFRGRSKMCLRLQQIKQLLQVFSGTRFVFHSALTTVGIKCLKPQDYGKLIKRHG